MNVASLLLHSSCHVLKASEEAHVERHLWFTCYFGLQLTALTWEQWHIIYIQAKIKGRQTKEAWAISPHCLLFRCLLFILWTFSSYQNKNACFCLWSTVLCTLKGTLVPSSLSAGETRLLSYTEKVTILCSYCAHPISRTLLFVFDKVPSLFWWSLCYPEQNEARRWKRNKG